MAEFDSNNDDNIKNIALFTENNNMLRKILDSVDSKDSLLKSVSAEDNITKSLGHIDKRLLGSLKNKSNVLLEDILRTNIDSLKLTNFISDRMIDVRNYIMKANRDLDNKDDENSATNIDDVSNILSEQLGVLISIDKTNKKVFDAQLDILYKSGVGRKGGKELSDDESELNDLKNSAKKLQYLNDIEYEKKRAKELKNDFSSGILSPTYLSGLIGAASGAIVSGIATVLSSPITIGAIAGAIATVGIKKRYESEEEKTRPLLAEAQKSRYSSLIPQTSADNKGVSTLLNPTESFFRNNYFQEGIREDLIAIKKLGDSADSLAKFDKVIKDITIKQTKGIQLTTKEQELLKDETLLRKKYNKDVFLAYTQAEKEGVEPDARVKGDILGRGYSNFLKDLTNFKEISKDYVKKTYDFNSPDYQKNLALATASGLTSQQYKNIYKQAGEQTVAGEGIGVKSTTDINASLKLYSEIITKLENLAKKTNLTQDETLNLKGNIKDFIKIAGNAENIIKIAQNSVNPQLKQAVIDETANVPAQNDSINLRASGGNIPLKGTTIVGENNPEFIKNNKVISPIGKSNATNRTTIEKTIKDSVNDNIKDFGKNISDSNNNISKNIMTTNSLLQNLINVMNSKENNINNTVLNNVQSSGNQNSLPTQRHDNPYKDNNRVKYTD